MLSQKIDKYIDLLHDSDFNIIFVKCDNHSTNATAFNLFLKKCLSKTSAHGNFWKYSSNSGYGIHLFFILYIYLKISETIYARQEKNIFPAFRLDKVDDPVSFERGEIT